MTEALLEKVIEGEIEALNQAVENNKALNPEESILKPNGPLDKEAREALEKATRDLESFNKDISTAKDQMQSFFDGLKDWVEGVNEVLQPLADAVAEKEARLAREKELEQMGAAETVPPRKESNF